MTASSSCVRRKLKNELGTDALNLVHLALRFVSVARSSTHVSFTRPEERRSKGWVGLAKLVGACILLVIVLFVGAEIASERCDSDANYCGFIPFIASPPPPPPPPPPPLVALSAAAKSTVTYCKSHPFQIAAAAGSLFLADFLNLAIFIDRLDPIVRVAQAIGTPARRVISALWRLVLRLRVPVPG